MEDSKSEALFDQCVFAVVPSRDLAEDYVLKLQRTLEENGATISELKADGSIKLDDVTHIISTTSDFPQYNLACEHMLPILTPGWITSSLLRNKQAPPRSFTPDPRLIFSGITICCAGLPSGDKDAIIGGVVAMGGQESSNLTRTVTHIVALTEEHQKCQEALEKRMKCKIVLPHWFDDCLKLGKRIDERPYLLPNPEILRKGSDEDVKFPNTAQMEGAISPRPEFLPTPTDTPHSSRRRLHVFNSKKVMLAEDLNLGSRLRGIIEDLIEGGGGTITTTIRKADIYVCHYREGKDYIIASRNGKDVGNLSWLYHLITHNEWTSPLRRLMHYPIPRGGIPGFEKFRITLSNYGGEARIYLENLVIAAGAEFTKSMKQDNTHLITARKASEKCNAAMEWDINMVNHLWIEESYAKCKVQSLTNPRYTHFPSRTNLGEIIGQTQFDRVALERIYYPEDPDESPEFPRQTRPVMQTKDNNATLALVPVVTGRETNSSPPAQKASVTKKRRSTGIATTSGGLPSAVTPSTNRLIGIGKENETPSSTSSRGAKDRALSKLHDMAPDVALYEKEKKRGGGGVWGGKRAADRVDRENARKRSSSSASLEEAANASDEEEHEIKRLKTGLPPIEMRLMITGYKRWLGSLAKEESDRKKLRDMGILVTQDPYNCTHLAAPSMVRTQKFLCALASGATIVSSDFIDVCLESGEMPPVDKYLLRDASNEKRFKLKLKDAVRRAKFNSRRLLQDVAVCCTADIINGPETFRAIVEVNGGTFFVYRGRGGFVLKRDEEEDEEAHHEEEPIYLLSGLKPDEKKLWPKFEQMARDGGMVPRIVVTEWLLDTAMSQEIKWDDSYLTINALA